MLEFLTRLVRNRKQFTARKLVYLIHIFNSKERRIALILLTVALISGGTFLARAYISMTKSAPRVGGTYTEGIIGEPHIINPLFASQDADRDLVRLLYAGLFTYNGQGDIQKDLADHYQISDDGKTYTVTLRKNLFWHDGKPLTAEDVLFTIKMIQNPQYKSVLRANWQGVTAEKLDDTTIQFTLRTSYAPFIENLTVGILPKHLWDSVRPDQAPLNDLNLKPVGSGPYMFKSIGQLPDGSITSYRIVRYSYYHREGPYIQNIYFSFFKTDTDALTALQKGKIDGFGPITTKKTQDTTAFQESIHILSIPRVFSIFFNTKKASALSDKRVRSAILSAINKKEIAQNATSGGAIPASFPLPLFGGGTGEDTYNPELAKRLLDDAGWKDSDGDGIRDKKTTDKGKKSVVTPLHMTLTTTDWPDLLKTADMVQGMLKQVGIDVTIEKKSFADLESEVIKPRQFDMLIFGQVYGYEPDPFAFWHSSQIKDPGLNIASYTNKKVDKILEDARKLSDPTERRKKYDELNKAITADVPAVFLYAQLYPYLLPTTIKGTNLTKISLPADRFNEINTWYMKTKRVF